MGNLYNWFISEGNIYVKSLSLPIILGLIYKIIIYSYLKFSDYHEKKNLFPFYSYQTIRNAKNNYIRTKCQNIDPAKEDLLKFFLKKNFKIEENENRFYLILGDSGMGKSTFMLNLFSKYTSFFNIEIGKKNIKLYPLGENFDVIKDKILLIQNPKNTILLLDGLDETPTIEEGDIHTKFNEIIDLVKEFYIVIITCRTHFFSSEQDEPFELKIKKFNTDGNGFHTVKKMYLSPFDERDIKKYIRKIFHIYEFNKKMKAYKIVKNTNDLMVRPMLLSYIKEIIQSDRKSLNTTFDIYETLISNWLKRETNKYEANKRFEFKSNLIYFSYSIAKYIYDNYDRNGIFIPIDEAAKISADFEINLDDIEIKSRSLLNRNSKGNYKFSHKSIFEFFIAYLSYINRKISNEGEIYTIDYNLSNYDQAKKFIEDILISNKTKFELPSINAHQMNYNIELYQQIIKEKNKMGNINIEWIDGNSFIVIRRLEPIAEKRINWIPGREKM